MRARTSLEVAKRFLEQLGYRVLREHVPVVLRGVEVGEVDLVVEDAEGRRYAVEVKAGRLSVSGVRQAKVNSDLLGLTPLVVARGYSDDAARILAEELGVKVVCLPDLMAVDEVELYSIVRAALEDAVLDIVCSLSVLEDPKAVEVLEAIASSERLEQAAELLGVEVRELEARLADMRRRGLIPPLVGYKRLRAYATALLILKKLALGEIRPIKTRGLG